MVEPSTVKPILSILRKDVGIGTEVERIVQLTWMVFLKALDDRETEKEILDERYRSPIPERFRWRSWASRDAEPRSGDALLRFVNDELIPSLEKLPASRDESATLVRDVFRIARNHMKSGALLRQTLDKLDEVDFNNLSIRRSFRDEVELLPSDLRAPAGELYTPPPLARLIVDLLDPELGEVVLDLHCGTGIFLTALVERLRDQWVRAPEHEAALARAILGMESTALGYMVTCTNLLLHGLVIPGQIRWQNPLLRTYGPGDRADVMLGVLPFGGQELPAVAESFPAAVRTSDPPSLHLLLTMQLLRPEGRAALVVPEGMLSGNGAKTRIREKLLEECDVHTIVRLPSGVFSPYTSMKTSVLFFTQGRPTKDVWIYDQRHPDGLRAYSKRRPLRAEDFDDLRAWWNLRRESEIAFQVTIDQIKARDFNLDLKSPRALGVTEVEIAAPSTPPPSPERRPAAPEAARAPIRLQALRLRCFRGFAKLDLELPRTGPAVLIGVNGAGKSTVLDAVAMFLSPLVTLASGLPMRQADIHIGEADIRAGDEVATAGATLWIDGEEQYWEIRASRAKGATTAREIATYARVLSERVQAGEASNLPVLCFYSATRTLGDDMGKRSALPSRQLQTYDRAFRRGLGSFHDFVRWFRLEEGLENQIRLREDPSHRNLRLEIVRRALQRFLGELGALRFSELRIERSGEEKEGALVIEKEGVPLRIEQLSEGEKNTILLVSDLARRLAVANPGLEDPLQGAGIVLIDELDLHLHPSWQRGLLPALSATFPGCQLIVTSHSPQVLSRIHREQVFVFENFALAQVTPHTYGRDPNSILGEVFGVPERPHDIEEKIHKAATLIDEERVEEAKVALDELLSILGEQDSEVVRLRTVLSFVEAPVVD